MISQSGWKQKKGGGVHLVLWGDDQDTLYTDKAKEKRNHSWISKPCGENMLQMNTVCLSTNVGRVKGHLTLNHGHIQSWSSFLGTPLHQPIAWEQRMKSRRYERAAYSHVHINHQNMSLAVAGLLVKHLLIFWDFFVLRTTVCWVYTEQCS